MIQLILEEVHQSQWWSLHYSSCYGAIQGIHRAVEVRGDCQRYSAVNDTMTGSQRVDFEHKLKSEDQDDTTPRDDIVGREDRQSIDKQSYV